MKLPNASPRGSFGIPPDIKEAHDKKVAEAAARNEAPPPPPQAEDWPMGEAVDQQEEDEAPALETPIDILRKIGIELTEKDFTDFIFRGSVSKVVNVASNPLGEGQLTAKIKAITTGELDLVDELLAEDIEKGNLTRDGLDNRKSLWILAFAVIELNDKPLARPVIDKDKVYLPKETARERRKVLSELNPAIVNKLINLHATFVSCLNSMIMDDKSVKK